MHRITAVPSLVTMLQGVAEQPEESVAVEAAQPVAVADVSMQIPLDEIKALFEKYSVGIPLKHAVKLQQIAQSKRMVFGIRPVDTIVKTLIEEGYPSKDLCVKGKSSNWGPMAGFICVDQALSKKENSSEAIVKQNQAVFKGLAAGQFSATQLEISHSRIRELEKLGVISTHVLGEQILSVTAVANRLGQSGMAYSFLAFPNGKGGYFIQRKTRQTQVGGYFEPLMVLADQYLHEPLTADYDLFFVAGRMEGFGQSDYRRDSDASNPELATVDLAGSRSRAASCKLFSIGDDYADTADNTRRQRSASIGQSCRQRTRSAGKINVSGIFAQTRTKSLGVISSRVADLMQSINATLGRGKYRDMVHHGEDAGNPYSDMADNFPATFFLPHALTIIVDGKEQVFPSVTVVADIAEYQRFVRAIKDSGFHFIENPNWPKSRRSSFEAARQVFASSKSCERRNTLC